MRERKCMWLCMCMHKRKKICVVVYERQGMCMWKRGHIYDTVCLCVWMTVNMVVCVRDRKTMYIVIGIYTHLKHMYIFEWVAVRTGNKKKNVFFGLLLFLVNDLARGKCVILSIHWGIIGWERLSSQVNISLWT